MKFTPLAKKNAGVGLIEVLIATVVVAVGLLAVGALQSNLVGDSRGNKTRAEAKALADTKIEQLRDQITKAGYDALSSGSGSTTETNIVGITETFQRNWELKNKVFNKTSQTWVDATLTGSSWGPNTAAAGYNAAHAYSTQVAKEIKVTACWSNGCPVSSTTANAQNQVKVQSVIAFDNTGNSIRAAKGSNSTSGPNLNQEASDDITKVVDLPTGQTTGAVYTAPDGKKYLVQDNNRKGILLELCDPLTAFENGLYVRRVEFDGAPGKEAIELYEKVTVASTDYCIARLRYNGGVIIPIFGTVYSRATDGSSFLNVNLFAFNATESGAYCVFKPQSGVTSAPYVCYVGGNCANGPAGTHKPDLTTASPGDDTIATECPNPTAAAAKVGPGGWRGKLGLLGIANTVESDNRNVCFAEEIAAAPATRDTARNYQTLHGSAIEGLNKPYACHDLMVIDGQNSDANFHEECVTQKSSIGTTTVLASKSIVRTVASASTNVFDPTADESSCGIIEGTIVNANTAPAVTLTAGAVTKPCETTSTTYTCRLPTAATSVTIAGNYSTQSKTCTLSPVSPTGCTLTFDTTADPSYTITGTITGDSNERNAVVLTLSNGGSCINHNNGNYTCTVTAPTATTSVTLTASMSVSGTVTPIEPQTIALSGPTIAGPAFDADIPSSGGEYTVGGNIQIGGTGGSNSVNITSVTAALNSGTALCNLTGTHANNTTDTYSCTTTSSGANDLTITISPNCSSGGGSKKYQIAVNGSTTPLPSTTGTLVIPINNSTGTLNISVTKTNTNC